MSWICSVCGLNNVNVNRYCAKCFWTTNKVKRPENFEPFDSIDEIISLHRIRLINRIIGEVVTPQEELFSHLFNHEKVLVKDMDILTLRAHREELAKIAFEARARLTAVDDEEKDRRKKKNGEEKRPHGFARNLNTDDQTSDAINAVKERQKRMSKSDKLVEGLMKLGYSREDAEKKMSAGTILGRIKNIKIEEKPTESKPPEPVRQVVNPFAKKE